MQARQELYVRKIRNGSVIDHITPGFALDVLKILGIDGKEGELVSAAMNVESKLIQSKDIVKIENRELNPREVDRIALIAPKATINIIRNYEVSSKKVVELPAIIQGTVKCDNPSCISNSREPVEAKFAVEQMEPVRLRCYFCGHTIERDDILRQF